MSVNILSVLLLRFCCVWKKKKKPSLAVKHTKQDGCQSFMHQQSQGKQKGWHFSMTVFCCRQKELRRSRSKGTGWSALICPPGIFTLEHSCFHRPHSSSAAIFICRNSSGMLGRGFSTIGSSLLQTNAFVFSFYILTRE